MQQVTIESAIRNWVQKKKYSSQLGYALVDHTDHITKGCLFVDLCQDIEISQARWALAKDRGALAVVTEHKQTENYETMPIVRVEGLTQKMPSLAACFYGHPAEQLHIFGVTGTNGKTSVSLLLAQSLSELGQKAGFIGTLGYASTFRPRDLSHFTKTVNTTPSATQLQRILAEFIEVGVSVVCMEISSHAIVQGRIQGIPIDIAAFTNLSRDHLDFHKTMFNYSQAKSKLFKDYHVAQAIINIDDTLGEEIAQTFPDAKLTVSKQSGASATYKVVSSGIKGSKFILTYNDHSYTINSTMIGDFNVENLCIVWLSLVALNYSPEVATKTVSALTAIPGRMQLCPQVPLKPVVVIDYSHTPTALEKSLKVLRKLTTKKLWCVFGCGGDRDQGKRPLMGQIAERIADRVVITQDNTRTEDADVIASDILNGMICPWAVEMEMDRVDAIMRAINEASPGDIVLVAGRGHEQNLLIGSETLHCCDYDVSCQALGVANVEVV